MNAVRTGPWLLLITTLVAVSAELRAQSVAREAENRLGNRPVGNGLLVTQHVPAEDEPENVVPAPGSLGALLPEPNAADLPPLPPLEEELWYHGGSYLYEPEGDHLNWPDDADAEHVEILRLPETWVEPRPLTLFSEFLGVGAPAGTRFSWFGRPGYMWDVRFVGAGRYELFGFALEENGQRQDAIGQQLVLDLDLRLTGTERFHVQFRPLGEGNSGGSYYQFSDPEGYVDFSHAEPDRYWFEGELASIFGGCTNPYAVLDYNVAVGKFPLVLHNSLLINDEILGVGLGKNTIIREGLSNLNVQFLYAFNDVENMAGDNRLVGVNMTIDRRRTFYEFSYLLLQNDVDSRRDARYLALSATRFYGPLSLAGRGLVKAGDPGGVGNGQLLVLESNYTRSFMHQPLGVEKWVFYCNAFYSSPGWTSISGGNLNRLRATFETNPLIRISAGLTTGERWGAALGVQLFRHHADESIIPEVALDTPDGELVWGCGVRYLRKLSARTYLEALATLASSNDPRFDREGVFASYHVAF